MKKLITLLLILCSFSAFGQTPFIIRGEIKQVYKTGSANDTVRQFLSGDSANYKTSKALFNYNKKVKAPLFLIGTDTASTKAYVRSLIGVESDPIWNLAQPYYVTRVELGDTAAAIRASSGSGSTIDTSLFVRKAGSQVITGSKTFSGGLLLTNDTTQTQPNSAMTEAQTKREINAADEWKPTAGGIKYEMPNDSIIITEDDGGDIQSAITYYSDNNKMTIQSVGLSSTSDNDTLFLTPNELTLRRARVLSIPFSEIVAFNKRQTSLSLGSGMFMNDLDTIKFGRNVMGVQQGDYFYTTKSGSIGIVSNGVKTYEVDSVGHVSFKGTYASIYRARALGDTTQSIPTGTTPTKILAFSTNGNYSNCTPDKDNDKITITKKGRYLANLSLSYASGAATVNWTAYVFVNGVESDNIHSTGYTATANDKRSTSTSGIIDVTSVPCDVDYRVTHSAGASVNLIFSYVNLSLTYIGD